jgi:hypothetical protein
MHTVRLFLALTAALVVIPARAELPGVYTIDRTIPLPAEGFTSVSLDVGPVTVTELRVRNIPDKEEIANASAREHSRPKPVVKAKNNGPVDVDLVLDTSLEDDLGESFLGCTRVVSLDAGETDDWSTCRLEAMYTRDWPKVRMFHLVLKVKLKSR